MCVGGGGGGGGVGTQMQINMINLSRGRLKAIHRKAIAGQHNAVKLAGINLGPHFSTDGPLCHREDNGAKSQFKGGFRRQWVRT